MILYSQKHEKLFLIQFSWSNKLFFSNHWLLLNLDPLKIAKLKHLTSFKKIKITTTKQAPSWALIVIKMLQNSNVEVYKNVMNIRERDDVQIPSSIILHKNMLTSSDYVIKHIFMRWGRSGQQLKTGKY
jgi:hypothetical protein